MYNEKPCIGLVFDQSYLIYDVKIPMDIIFTIMNHNRTAYFIYGGIERLTNHVEWYGEDLHIPKEHLIPLPAPCCVQKHMKVFTKALAEQWFTGLLKYQPDIIHVFKDNSHTTETSTLMMYANRSHIPVMEYDNRGVCRQIGDGTPSDINNFYKKRSGRIPYYD